MTITKRSLIALLALVPLTAAAALLPEDSAARREALAYDGSSVGILEVKDVEASLAWYGRHFGFETLMHVKEIGWAEVRTSVPGLALGLSQDEEPEITERARFTMGVHDLDAALMKLAEGGVEHEGEILEYPGLVRLAVIVDPSGNRFMLHQSLSTD